MTDEQRDLARRLAAHPRWVWRRGVLALFEPAPYCYGELRIEEDGWTPTWCDDIAQPNGWPDVKRVAWPDLTDAATGGVLWEMAGRLEVTATKESVRVGLHDATGSTLAEACARALLAEWGDA